MNIRYLITKFLEFCEEQEYPVRLFGTTFEIELDIEETEELIKNFVERLEEEGLL